MKSISLNINTHVRTHTCVDRTERDALGSQARSRRSYKCDPWHQGGYPKINKTEHERPLDDRELQIWTQRSSHQCSIGKGKVLLLLLMLMLLLLLLLLLL